MAPEPLRSLLRGLRRLGECAGGALSDAELLDRFVRQRDEAAFEVLVWRHGPLVLGVCRRLLRHEQDIEDAFQATFLALVRKAHTIVRREAVAAWLYRVAYRVALAARGSAADRAAREQPWADQRAATEPDEVLWRDLRPVLDEEVMRLPEKYRTPFVLCCLEGKTNEETAAQLGCPRGTVLSRLARARERLRWRLARRGVTLSAAALVAAAGERGLAALPTDLAEFTIRAVPVSTAGVTAAAGVSARVAALAEGVLHVMFLNRLKTVLLVMLVLALTGAGAGLLAAGMLPGEAGGAPQAGAGAPPAQQAAGAPAGDAEKTNPAEEARLRRKSANNLKEIGLALHNHHDTYKAFPAPAIYSGGPPMPGGGGIPMGPGGGAPTTPGSAPTGSSAPGAGIPGEAAGAPSGRIMGGKPLLSWRVAILPYIEQDPLYRQFKLDEPWDSPHNKKLLAKIPDLYAPVRGPSKVEGGTYYQVIVGTGAGFEPGKKLRIPRDFADGTSNTILVVEAARPVPWTKPEDLPYVPDQALPQFGGQFHGHFFAVFADGGVSLLSRNADEEMLRRAITRDDGLQLDHAKLVAPLTDWLGKIDLDLLPGEVERLKNELKKAQTEVAQTRVELAVLVAKLKDSKLPQDARTRKLIEEHQQLQFDLERTRQVLDALRTQAQRLRQELQPSKEKKQPPRSRAFTQVGARPVYNEQEGNLQPALLFMTRTGAPMTATPPFRTSPSTIARYFFHDCERFLYYSSADPKERRRQGIPAPAFDRSPVKAALLTSGFAWERAVVEDLLKGRVVIAPGAGALNTRRLSPAQTLRELRRQPAGRFLYQPTLTPPPRFYEAHGIDPKLVAISDNHPDLIAVLPDEGGGRLLRVVDIKRGESLKLTHRVQILLYALELQALLDEEGITSVRADLERGAVWLGQQPEPEVFDISAFRPHLERFLRHDLMRILFGAARDARWHLCPRCEWCDFFEHCREEMRRTDDLSRLGELTTRGKRHLVEEAGVRNLTELGRFLKRADADEVLDRCASLAGQRHRLAGRVAALETAQPQLLGATCPDLPRGENLGLFLTLQHEPVGKAVYLAGLLVSGREDLRREVFTPELAARLANSEGKPEPSLWLAAGPGDVPAVRREFVELLHEVLSQVHGYNAEQPEWKDKLSLQAYVHSEQERALVFATLLEALREPALAEKATTLLFHFQGPELMHADRHPGDEVAYPVVVLQSAVRRLLALPVEVSYTLPEMLDALGSPFHYTRKDYYHFALGHGLRADALHAAWYGGKADNLDDIRRQGRLYLFAVQALLRSVRERAEGHLVTWAPKFALPTGAGIRDRLLSRLTFFARHESLLRCLAVREARSEARPTQVRLGQAIELRARSASEMEVVGALVNEPETGGFPNWLLVRDSADGRRAQGEYADYWYRNNYYGGPDSPHRAVVGVQEVAADGRGKTVLRLKYARPFKGDPASRGERFLLYERFTDFTTDKVVEFLAALDENEGGLFLDLLRNPEASASPLPLAKKVEATAARAAESAGFTPSQRAAYEAICRQRVTAVWGPPGTGKTHFLATAVLALAEAHARAGRPFRVLVTAYTHAAIENLLRKLAERGRELGGAAAQLPLAKAKYWQTADAGVETISEDETGGWLADNDQAVLGATVYSCLKSKENLGDFDLVVIDEASQVRVPEAAVAVSLVGDGGRLVLAGDHLQLPPIVAGAYPDPPPGEPVLHRSIFEAVAPRDGRQSRILRPLLENFRMNDVLTGVAARLLYGPDYRCVSAEVARRRLPFKPGRGADPLVRACLDPAFPLVVVVLEGVRAGRANPVEADLVAQLVAALREGLRDRRGRRYADDAAFFREGVFVVSPHHAQIQAIQGELARRRQWTATPFVDTVDKMQGQETDAVVISYGVADPEFALSEAEFIYGLNRLNVAVTRARTKTVVCLPRPLLDATPQVLDVESAAAGLAFMRRLVATAEEAGEELVFEGEQVEARVLRVGRPVG